MASYDDTATVSGSVVSIDNGADEVGTKSCVVTISPTLDGVSSVTETQTGRNLFDLVPYLATAYNTPSFSDCMFVKGGSYTFSFDKISDGTTDATSWRYCVTVYDTEGQLVTDWTISAALQYRAALYSYVNGANSSNKYITFNLQDDCYIFIRFWSGNTTADMNMISPMLELGNTASAFEPYSGTTYTASLGRTIYGGQVDIVNGTGTDENGNDFAFDGQEIPTRLGYNAFWSEQGNTELTYYKSGYGFTSVTVNKTGKNFLDDNLSNLEQGSINGSTGNNENANNRVRSIHAIPFPYDGIVSSYTWTIPNGYKVAIRPYDANENFVQLPSWALGFITQLPQNLIGQGITQMRFVLAKTDNSAITPSEMANIGFQIALGSQATEYEPYEAVSKTAYLHKVIYGGQADVVKGTCEPKNLAEFSNADNVNRDSFSYTTEKPELIEWTKTGSGGKFYARFILHIPKPGKYTISCTNDSTVKAKYIYSDELWGTSVYSSVSTNPFVAEFSASGNYVMGFYAGSSATSGTLGEVMCEEGETQTSYAPYFAPFSFPPINMETDEGENTLYASEGDSVITYRKETD